MLLQSPVARAVFLFARFEPQQNCRPLGRAVFSITKSVVAGVAINHKRFFASRSMISMKKNNNTMSLTYQIIF